MCIRDRRNTYPVLAQGKMVKHPVYNDGNTSQQSIAAWYRELDGERMLVVHLSLIHICTATSTSR